MSAPRERHEDPTGTSTRVTVPRACASTTAATSSAGTDSATPVSRLAPAERARIVVDIGDDGAAQHQPRWPIRLTRRASLHDVDVDAISDGEVRWHLVAQHRERDHSNADRRPRRDRARPLSAALRRRSPARPPCPGARGSSARQVGTDARAAGRCTDSDVACRRPGSRQGTSSLDRPDGDRVVGRADDQRHADDRRHHEHDTGEQTRVAPPPTWRARASGRARRHRRRWRRMAS